MKKKVFFSFLILILITVIAGCGYLYYAFYTPNINQSQKLYIPTNATYGQLVDSLKPLLKDVQSFKLAARIKNLDKHIHAGRYNLSKDLSNDALIDLLRSGNQDAISIRIGNYTNIFEMASRVAPFLECDSQQIVAGILQADYTQGFDTSELLYFFIPNTYVFHWDLSGAEFAQKMKSHFDAFWTPKRLSAAKKHDMTPLQVTILASIVQMESAKADEQPKVAGLYLNRLSIGMKLDADPTVIFAMRKEYGWDKKITRVTYKDLRIPSPYNTYLHRGLPPGPICMPNPSAINAVLHPVNHDYLFFVANPKQPGYHLFAYTLAEQNRNAQKYHQWLDSIEEN